MRTALMQTGVGIAHHLTQDLTLRGASRQGADEPVELVFRAMTARLRVCAVPCHCLEQGIMVQAGLFTNNGGHRMNNTQTVVA